MSWRVVWSQSALERVTEFLDFISEDNPEAARRVVDELFARVEILAEHPNLGRPWRKHPTRPSLRRLIAGSYVVVYGIQKPQQTISVIAVRHSRQRSLAEEEDL